MKKILTFLLFSLSCFGAAISNQWIVQDQVGVYNAVSCLVPQNLSVGSGGLTMTANYTAPGFSCGDSSTTPSIYYYTGALMSANTATFGPATTPLCCQIQFQVTTPSSFSGGQWPAIWMFGAGCNSGAHPFKISNSCTNWPNNNTNTSEIDLMEWLGTANFDMAIHTAPNLTTSGTGCCCVPTNQTAGTSYVMNVLWTATPTPSITFALIGSPTQVLCTYTDVNIPTGQFFPIFDFAVGGYGGTPNQSQYPISMKIGYFRVCPTTASTCDAASATIFDEEFNGTGPQSDIYLSQTAQGNITGNDCADAFGLVNNGQNTWASSDYWKSPLIGPGTNLHLCGSVTGVGSNPALQAYSSGNSGNPITFNLNAGATLTGCIARGGFNFITLNGISDCTPNASYVLMGLLNPGYLK